MGEKRIEDYVRTIPDFPEKGVMFRDITTILEDPEGLKLTVDKLCESLKDVDFDLIVGLESRGFIFGVPMAYAMHKGFVPEKKRGKLPHKIHNLNVYRERFDRIKGATTYLGIRNV